jgi:hypothetical protein
MKKSVLFPILVISGLISSTAMASVLSTITVTCPVTSGDPVNQLRNFANSYIAGNGSENVDIGTPQTSTVLFKSSGTLPSGIPGNLTTYSSSSTSFSNNDPINPFITCSYTSSNSAFPDFSVNFSLLNGFGAEVSSSTASTITLVMPVGVNP